MSKQNSFYTLVDDVSEQTVSYWDTCRIAYNKIPNQTEFSEHFVVTLMQAAPARLGDGWIARHNFVSCSWLSVQWGSSRPAISAWRMTSGTTSQSNTSRSIYASEVSQRNGQFYFRALSLVACPPGLRFNSPNTATIEGRVPQPGLC